MAGLVDTGATFADCTLLLNAALSRPHRPRRRHQSSCCCPSLPLAGAPRRVSQPRAATETGTQRSVCQRTQGPGDGGRCCWVWSGGAGWSAGLALASVCGGCSASGRSASRPGDSCRPGIVAGSSRPVESGCSRARSITGAHWDEGLRPRPAPTVRPDSQPSHDAQVGQPSQFCCISARVSSNARAGVQQVAAGRRPLPWPTHPQPGRQGDHNPPPCRREDRGRPTFRAASSSHP